MTDHKNFWKRERGIYRVLIVICTLALILAIILAYFGDISEDAYKDLSEDDPDKIENGIHLRTGLIAGEGLMETVNNCTSCHSANLIMQNRLSKEGWISAIRWMQETQNLWDLGKNEEVIIDYLVKNYPPQAKGRRAPLEKVDWYNLEQ